MRRGKIIVVLAFLVAVIPALGVPQDSKNIAISVLGVLIAFIGLTLRRPPRQPSLFSASVVKKDADVETEEESAREEEDNHEDDHGDSRHESGERHHGEH